MSYLSYAEVPGEYCDNFTGDPHKDRWRAVQFDLEYFYNCSDLSFVWIPGFTEPEVDAINNVVGEHKALRTRNKEVPGSDGRYALFAYLEIDSATHNAKEGAWTAVFSLKSLERSVSLSHYNAVGPYERSWGTYLKVSFDQKDQVKQLGARWDSRLKLWYIPKGKDPMPFQPWFFPGREHLVSTLADSSR